MATDTPPRRPDPDTTPGMAHPTVVPANFDPDAPGKRRD